MSEDITISKIKYLKTRCL